MLTRLDGKIHVLSVRQPWAWLIATGQRTTHNDSLNTDQRGTFLIHAAKRAQSKGARAFVEGTYGVAPPRDLPRNGIVGVATLVDILPNYSTQWIVGP